MRKVLIAVLGALCMAPGFRSGTPTFSVLRDGSSLSGLSGELCINGTCVAPTFRYEAKDADGSDWDAATYGEQLTAYGSGGAFDQATPLTDTSDKSVNPETTRYWKASGNDFADVTTEDMVVEMVVKATDTSGDYVLTKYDGSTGWYVNILVANRLDLLIKNGAALSSVAASGLVGNHWYHVIWFVDRSGSGVAYVNGVAGTPAVVSTVSGSITVAIPVTVGALAFGSSGTDYGIAYAALWKQDTWLDTHLQATIAKQRFHALAGVYPNIASGTAVGTFTRATEATVDINTSGTITYHRVGAGWPRTVYRCDASAVCASGYLSEPASTNNFDYSDDFANWTAANVTIDANAVASPIDGESADGIDTASVDGDVTHCVTKNGDPDATQHLFSVIVKAGAQSWVRIASEKAGPTAVGTYFNLSTGTEGTSFGTPDDTMIEALGGGWYRIGLLYQGPAASHTHSLCPAEGDGDYTYTGTDGTDLYAIGALHEKGPVTPSSLIYTAGAADTRNEDELQFVANNGNVGGTGSLGRGAVRIELLCPDTAQTLPSTLRILNIDDNSTDNRLTFYVPDTGAAFNMLSTVGGVDQADVAVTTDITDNEWHTVQASFRTDEFRNIVDGTAGTTDTSGSVPTGLTEIDVGDMDESTAQPQCIIRDVRIHPAPLPLAP